jgi:uncharacterized membrane protein YczE
MMNKAIWFALSVFFYCLTGVGVSLTIKAGIGVSSFNSLNLALSEGLNMTVGTVTTVLNGLFLAAYMALERFIHPPRYLLQAAAVLCLGRVIDFFTFGVFAGLDPGRYAVRVALFILGTVVTGASTGLVLSLETLAFPIESACREAETLTGWPFRRIRYALDVVFVLGSLILSRVLGRTPFVREGTLISLFLLTASISAAKKTCGKWTAGFRVKGYRFF